jgi:hypothetical protein
VLDDRGEAPSPGDRLGLPGTASPVEDHDRRVDADELDQQLPTSALALLLEVQPALAREQQRAHLATYGAGPVAFDHDGAHQVAAGACALVDERVQRRHLVSRLVPKMTSATVSAASASRLGATWL